MAKIRKDINGENNEIIFDETSVVKYLDIQIEGDGNVIKVGQGSRLTNQKIVIEGSGNRVLIGENSLVRGKPDNVDEQLLYIKGDSSEIDIGDRTRVHGQVILKGNESHISIGERTTLGSVYILAAENTNIDIGKDCMFSHGISVRTSDSHSIVDLKSGKRTNFAKDVAIGDHVWIGMGALMIRGSVVPSGCIVATGAVVTKAFTQENCSIGGIPAKILNEQVTWDRRLLPE